MIFVRVQLDPKRHGRKGSKILSCGKFLSTSLNFAATPPPSYVRGGWPGILRSLRGRERKRAGARGGGAGFPEISEN